LTFIVIGYIDATSLLGIVTPLVPENLKKKGTGVGVGVGVVKGKTAQSNTALKSNVLHAETGDGAGVGQTCPNIDLSKSGHRL
jgi:hypothetical protein